MIVAKPKLNTFFALGVFLLLIYGSAFYLLYDLQRIEDPAWWRYLLFIVLLLIGLIVTIKMLSSYKRVVIEKNRMDIFSYFGLMKRRLYFKDLHSWREESVSTSNGLFKQLLIVFDEKKSLRLANKEHQGYDKVVGFLRRNFKKKEHK